MDMTSPANLHFSADCSGVPLLFPFLLHQMLTESEHAGCHNIVSWSPCGTMFKVHEQDAFAKFIMPKYCRHSRFKSFLRQLSMYKFERVTKGPYRGAYSHPYFRRHRLDMCRGIIRGEKYVVVKKKKKTTEEEKLEPKRATMDTTDLSVSSHDDDSSKSPIEDFLGDSLGGTLEPTYLLPCPQVNTPEDILDEIISTFGSKKSEPEAFEVASRCA